MRPSTLNWSHLWICQHSEHPPDLSTQLWYPLIRWASQLKLWAILRRLSALWNFFMLLCKSLSSQHKIWSSQNKVRIHSDFLIALWQLHTPATKLLLQRRTHDCICLWLKLLIQEEKKHIIIYSNAPTQTKAITSLLLWSAGCAAKERLYQWREMRFGTLWL